MIRSPCVHSSLKHLAGLIDQPSVESNKSTKKKLGAVVWAPEVEQRHHGSKGSDTHRMDLYVSTPCLPAEACLTDHRFPSTPVHFTSQLHWWLHSGPSYNTQIYNLHAETFSRVANGTKGLYTVVEWW